MTLPESTTGKLEALKQKIAEANPDVVTKRESKRMRALLLAAQRYADAETGKYVKEDRGISWDELQEEIGKALEYGSDELVEFRPIRLADVCKAIQEVGTSSLHDCPDGGRNVASVLLDLWNFDHDDLERQSEECVTYLSSLLVR